MNIAEAINGMLAGKTVVCSNTQVSEYQIKDGQLLATDRYRSGFFPYCIGDALNFASYFKEDKVTISLSELKQLKDRIIQLERGEG